ncbi:type II toxin-antitoxin system YafQ family toxin [Stutzerimonas stutzeri]|uniref:type II toxin-antitoxin system YafQ family toxin n=1 Tax=Stutzerimonas stutzeri TaxID=316 RepID=UPI0015E33592|nr:type II toxin-antitoxin system YafQ family toxin [Stutzerimonas stutzeri]MBA1262673.1 type II toxin-antitoxin system YafQ family toxin [Stutzerimonas stutzeri]
MTLELVPSSAFKKDFKRGKNMDKLKTLLNLLVYREPLPSSYLDHPLKSNWKGFRDAHIEPHQLLIYRLEGDELQLARTGTHADIFNK